MYGLSMAMHWQGLVVQVQMQGYNHVGCNKGAIDYDLINYNGLLPHLWMNIC